VEDVRQIQMLPALLFDPEDGDSTLLRNVGKIVPDNGTSLNTIQTASPRFMTFSNEAQTLSLACYTNAIVSGRAIAQAVSRRLPTAAARVQTRVWSCGIL
jgi:hypothetical protein